MKILLIFLVLLLTSVVSFAQTSADEATVRKVLETETRAFHEANAELLRAQWSVKPYVERQNANLQEATGAPFLKGDRMRQFADGYMKTLKPSGHTVRISDYDAHISGATA